MPKFIKVLLSLAVLWVWGPYLLYVWVVPASVPGWVHGPGMRKALMLDRNFEPTIFTLLFGITFTGIAIVGLWKLTQGKLDLEG